MTEPDGAFDSRLMCPAQTEPTPDRFPSAFYETREAWAHVYPHHWSWRSHGPWVGRVTVFCVACGRTFRAQFEDSDKGRPLQEIANEAYLQQPAIPVRGD
jgi:hypothetical protein